MEDRLSKQWGVLRRKPPERLLLARALDASIRRILDKEEWRWAVTFGAVGQFTSGDRELILPPDFGTNFLKQEESYSVYLTDTSASTDSDILYEPPEQLFRRWRTGQANGVPSYYTIHWTPTGKFMVVDPPADGTYKVTGSYKRSWDSDYVTDDSDVPLPVPDAAMFDALIQIFENPDWRGRAQEALESLYLSEKDGFVLSPQNDPRYSRWERP